MIRHAAPLALAVLAVSTCAACSGARAREGSAEGTPSAAAPRTSASRAPDANAQAFLDAHNRARSRLNLPPLAWSSELSRMAQRAAATCTGDHSQTSFGENIYGLTGAPRPEDAVGAWMRESAYYDYRRNACQSGKMCGHYTQVVWRSTQLVGCAIQPCGRWTYVYCAYDPPGNWRGEKPY